MRRWSQGCVLLPTPTHREFLIKTKLLQVAFTQSSERWCERAELFLQGPGLTTGRKGGDTVLFLVLSTSKLLVRGKGHFVVPRRSKYIQPDRLPHIQMKEVAASQSFSSSVGPARLSAQDLL